MYGAHAVAPNGTTPYEPAAHGKHAVEPAMLAYVFAGHGVQPPADDVTLIHPAAQLEHADAPAALNSPGMHVVAVHAVDEDAPTAVVQVPAAHGAQEPEPALTPTEPAGHAWHADAPLGAYDPTLHERHVAWDVAPTAALTVPAPHGVHAEAPVLDPHDPGKHGEQAAAPACEYVPTPHGEPPPHSWHALPTPAMVMGVYPGLHVEVTAGQPAQYDPAAHGEHGDDEPRGLVEPGAHGVGLAVPLATHAMPVGQ